MMQASKLKEMVRLSEQRRRVPRDVIDLITMCTRDCRTRESIRLVDISPLGFHARANPQFERNERVRLVLPIIGDVEAQVAWALKGCFGGWFLQPVPEDIYPRILATIKTGRSDWGQ